MSAVKRSRTRRLLRLVGLVCLLAIAAAHASDNSKSTLEVFTLLDFPPDQQVAVNDTSYNGDIWPVWVSGAGSSPISTTPPPPVSASALGLTVQGGAVVPKPPSLQSLEQQLAAQEQELANQQAGLAQAQSTLAIFQGQVAQFCNPFLLDGSGNPNPNYSETNCAEAQSFVQQWEKAVTTDQNIIEAIQNQIAQLQAQIAAAQ